MIFKQKNDVKKPFSMHKFSILWKPCDQRPNLKSQGDELLTFGPPYSEFFVRIQAVDPPAFKCISVSSPVPELCMHKTHP